MPIQQKRNPQCYFLAFLPAGNIFTFSFFLELFFTSGPKVFFNSSARKPTTLDKLSGCVLKSTILPMANITFYYVKDNQTFHKIYEGLFPLNRSLPERRFLNPVATDQGVYQCVVFADGIGYVKSEPVGVQFEGINII